jgi:hypothetical protein
MSYWERVLKQLGYLAVFIVVYLAIPITLFVIFIKNF